MEQLEGTVQDLGQLTGKQIVLGAAQAPDKVLAPNRPLSDPGRPLTYLTGDVDQIIASGFGISLDAVRKVASTAGVVAALNGVAVPQTAATTFDAAAGTQLKSNLSNVVDQLTAGSISSATAGTLVPGSFDIAEPERDALDDLIDKASKARLEKP